MSSLRTGDLFCPKGSMIVIQRTTCIDSGIRLVIEADASEGRIEREAKGGEQQNAPCQAFMGQAGMKRIAACADRQGYLLRGAIEGKVSPGRYIQTPWADSLLYAFTARYDRSTMELCFLPDPCRSTSMCKLHIPLMEKN